MEGEDLTANWIKGEAKFFKTQKAQQKSSKTAEAFSSMQFLRTLHNVTYRHTKRYSLVLGLMLSRRALRTTQYPKKHIQQFSGGHFSLRQLPLKSSDLQPSGKIGCVH